MTTLSPEPGPFGDAERTRQVAQSFGTNAERYDRVRPSYPDALIQRIVAASPGPAILDVGCGTGIVSRQFQAAGCHVLGVDPDARMAEQARQAGIDVEVAEFETWDPAGREFDAVVAGQAWHWIDMIAGAAQAARVLRPGGVFAVFWNAFEPPPALRDAMTEVLGRMRPPSAPQPSVFPGPDAYMGLCDRAADGMRLAGGFGAAEKWRFDWDRRYTRDEWLDQVPTFGPANTLSPEKLNELVTGLSAAVDTLGGSFTMHYGTVAAVAPRTPH